MKVALIQCPAFGIDRPPIALAYLAGSLRKEGHQADIYDLNIDLYSKTEEKNKKFWDFDYIFQWSDQKYFYDIGLLSDAHFKNWAREIAWNKPDIIGFSVQSSSLLSSLTLAKYLKNILPSNLIIFGGPLTSTYGEIEHVYSLFGIKDGHIPESSVIDVVVLGEGEETLNEVLKRSEKKESLQGCLGAISFENREIIKNDARPLIKDIDGIVFPDFKGFPDSYKSKKRLPFLGSRGCIRSCIFCDDCKMWQHYRSRSTQNMIEEIKLRRSQGIEFLEFNDLLINGDLSQLLKLCQLLIKEKIGIYWGGSAAVRPDMNLKLLKKMKKAGCVYLNFGIESGSAKVLKEMNKGFSLQAAEKNIKDTYKAGIQVCTNWIVGFPTETDDDFIDTLKFIKRNRKFLKSGLMVNSFILKANSFLYNNTEKYNIEFDDSGNWFCPENRNTRSERERRFRLFNEFASLGGFEIAHKTILEVPHFAR